MKLLEESFMKKGIPVTVEKFPEGMEGAADAHETNQKYSDLRMAVSTLNSKYGISTKTRTENILEAA